jgi:hypothetical protein
MPDTLIETPNRLADVPDPCTEEFYPEWNSRGMRAARCTRPAKATLTEPNGTERRVCGIHRNRYARLDGWLVRREPHDA